MAFRVKGFDQEFNTIKEYKEAERLRIEAEKSISNTKPEEKITHVTATVIPASEGLLESTIAKLEEKISDLSQRMDTLGDNLTQGTPPEANRQGLPIGLTLRGESKGREFTLETIKGGYLCSDGNIYDSLSGAALGVSGNRRSGWKFWKTIHGVEIGEVTGRFKKNERDCTSGPF